MMLLGFLKGLKLETILFGVITIVCALTIAYAAWTRSNLKAVEASLALETMKRQIVEQQLSDVVETFDKRINSIKALEQSRKTGRLEIDPLRQRVENVNRKSENAPDSPLTDRLNRINADANRMLEQNSR